MGGAGIALTGIAGIAAKVTPRRHAPRLLTTAAIISDRNLAGPPCKKVGGLLPQKQDPPYFSCDPKLESDTALILTALASWLVVKTIGP
jgi:hypothetical protein